MWAVERQQDVPYVLANCSSLQRYELISSTWRAYFVLGSALLGYEGDARQAARVSREANWVVSLRSCVAGILCCRFAPEFFARPA